MPNMKELIDHAIYNEATELLPLLKIVLEDKELLASLNENDLLILNRTELFIKSLLQKLDVNDPLIFNKEDLDNIHKNIVQVKEQLENYDNIFNDSTRLSNFNKKINLLVKYMASLPDINSEESVDNIRESVTSFRKSIGQQQSYLSREQNQIESDFNELVSKHSRFEEKLSEMSDQIQQETEKIREQNNSIEEKFINLKEKYSKELLEEVEKYRKEHQDSLSENKEEFKNLINEFTTQLEEKHQEFLEENNVFVKSREEQNQKYDEILDSHKNSVEELVGRISTNSIAGHFSRVADANKKSLIVWHVLTILGFLGTIGFGVIFLILKGEDLDWINFVSRIIVTSASGSFTAFAAHQANKNEVEERKNRKMEVELRTLGPYIASLSREEQGTLKKELFPKIFNQGDFHSSTNLQDDSRDEEAKIDMT